jgi:hypothetical protein
MANDEVEYLHVHTARRGCFLAAVSPLHWLIYELYMISIEGVHEIAEHGPFWRPGRDAH